MTTSTSLLPVKALSLSLVLGMASFAVVAEPMVINGGIGLSSTAESARDLFLTRTQGIVTETFESAPFGVPLAALSVFGGGGQLEQDIFADGSIKQGVLANGRFNTTPGCDINTGGCRWWETAQSFEILLNSPKSAFGFFATDLGDLGGSVNLDFWSGNSIVRSGISVSTANAQLGLLFFGFIDDTFTFNKVSFNVMQTATDPIFFDYVGFDDLLVGARSTTVTPPVGVPAPAPLALVGLGLGLMALTRSRRS